MLAITHLVGFGAGSSLGMIDSRFIEHVHDATTTASRTLANRNLGTPAANRDVAVGIVFPNANAPTITGVTINGATATQIVAATRTGGIWAASVPNGATGDIVITTSFSIADAFVSIYALYGASLTPYDTATSTADPADLTIDIPANGFLIAIASAEASTSYTWTNATEDFDNAPGGPRTASGASRYSSTLLSTLAVSTDPATGTPSDRGIAATFQAT